MEKNRFIEIDLMKILSCLAVIAIHITARGVTDPEVPAAARGISQFINAISYFAVPSFIFLSGLALILRYQGKPLSASDFMQKRVNNILAPYLGWSLGYYLLYTVAGYYALSLSNVLSAVVLGTGEYHLYFVVILFQLYLLFPLLKGITERLGTGLTAALAIAVQWFFSYQVAPFPYMDRVFVPYLIFFIAGMLWGRHYGVVREWINRHRVWTGLSYLILAALYLIARFKPESSIAFFPQLWQVFSLASILMLMTLTGTLSASIRTKDQVSRVITLSAATFYVYLAHPLFIAGFYKFCRLIGFNDLTLILPVNYLLSASLSFGGALIYLKYKSARTQKTNPRTA